MASNDKTVFDGDATVYEDDTVFDGDATVYDGDETVLEDDNATVYEDEGATVYEADDDATADKPLSNEEIVKGGSILDTYTVESDPIHGGMGSVWKVHHKNWNADLAMKRPQPHCFATEKSKERFIEECKTWINLGLHPNIVSCYYVRDIGGTPTIFSEWMEYGSLENRIEDESLYAGSEKEQQMRILDIAIQFARGLHYAHEQGHIHQDVKPDNLLLTKAWDAKVADFGLAKARAMLTYLEMDDVAIDGSKTIITPSGGRSPHYCSMEQLDGKPLTRKTDIYSWAVSVLEMYLGYKPWANGAFDSGPIAGLNCREYFTMARLPMPEAMKDLLVRCLAAEPAERPHDFNMVEDELKAVYLTVAGSTYPRQKPEAVPDSADSLNNKALSYLDLAEPETANKLWEKATKADASHFQTVCNQYVYSWRTGACDYQTMIDRISALGKDGYNNTLMDRVVSNISEEGAYTQINAEYLISKDYTSKYTDACFLGNNRIAAVNRSNHITILDTSKKTEAQIVELKRDGGILKNQISAITASPDGKYLFTQFFRIDLMNDFRIDDMENPYPYFSERFVESGYEYSVEAIWINEETHRVCELLKNGQRGGFEDGVYWDYTMFYRYCIVEWDLNTLNVTSCSDYGNAFLSSQPPVPVPFSKGGYIADNRKISVSSGDCRMYTFTGAICDISANGNEVIIQDDYGLKIFKAPPIQRKYEYLLNTVERTEERIHHAKTVVKLQSEFKKQVEAKEYSDAVNTFYMLRDLPGMLNAEETVFMERELAKYVRRSGVHHIAAEPYTGQKQAESCFKYVDFGVNNPNVNNIPKNSYRHFMSFYKECRKKIQGIRNGTLICMNGTGDIMFAETEKYVNGDMIDDLYRLSLQERDQFVYSGKVLGLRVSEDGTKAAFDDNHGIVFAWEENTGWMTKHLCKVENPRWDSIRIYGFSPDSQLLTFCVEGNFYLFDCENNNTHLIPITDQSKYTQLHFSEDGMNLIRKNDKTGEITCFRISFDYKIADYAEIKTKNSAGGAASDGRNSTEKKSSLFSGLFGKKK